MLKQIKAMFQRDNKLWDFRDELEYEIRMSPICAAVYRKQAVCHGDYVFSRECLVDMVKHLVQRVLELEDRLADIIAGCDIQKGDRLYRQIPVVRGNGEIEANIKLKDLNIQHLNTQLKDLKAALRHIARTCVEDIDNAQFALAASMGQVKAPLEDYDEGNYVRQVS